MKQFTAGVNENEMRLSRFVESVTIGLPMSLLYKAFRNKRIKVNGKRAAADTRLCTGDCIELYLNDEFFALEAQSAAEHPSAKAPKREGAEAAFASAAAGTTAHSSKIPKAVDFAKAIHISEKSADSCADTRAEVQPAQKAAQQSPALQSKTNYAQPVDTSGRNASAQGGSLAAAGNPRASRTSSKSKKATRRLCVVYEDENIAVLYKPAHLLCHSDRTGDSSLVEQFSAYLQTRGEYDPTSELTFRPALCNRLDRGTEGLVLAAKNYAALRDLNAIIRDDLVQKQYLCITAGIPPKGVHKAFLRHFEKDNKVEVVAAPVPGYKQILTGVTIEQRKGPYALCRIDLITGRTHQIRAHLAYLEAPVLGDIKYGNRRLNAKTGFTTQALCAVGLTFGAVPAASTLHYLSGKVVALEEPAIMAQFAAL